jgi:hypothetical protein
MCEQGDALPAARDREKIPHLRAVQPRKLQMERALMHAFGWQRRVHQRFAATQAPSNFSCLPQTATPYTLLRAFVDQAYAHPAAQARVQVVKIDAARAASIANEIRLLPAKLLWHCLDFNQLVLKLRKAVVDANPATNLHDAAIVRDAQFFVLGTEVAGPPTVQTVLEKPGSA